MSLKVNFYFHAHLVEAKTLDVLTANVVEKLQARLTASPTGPSTSIALWRVILDPDEFGGAERKVPMADLAVE